MSTFIPVFILIIFLSAVMSLIVVLFFARMEGAPPIINFRQKYREFSGLSLEEKMRLAYHVPFAILMGAFACLALLMLFPTYPVIALVVFTVAGAMATATLSMS
jgi:hypothetical protein